jgi:hypothetical protein
MIGKIVCLELEGELREMVYLGEKIQWEIGLLESNLVALVDEGISEPEVQFEEVEFALQIYNQVIFVSQRYSI